VYKYYLCSGFRFLHLPGEMGGMPKNKKKSDLVFWRNYHDKQQFLSSTLSDKSKRLIRTTEDKSTTLIIAAKLPVR
jgi:hypothetical protein